MAQPPKEPMCRDRIRSIPRSFGWVDHRLVRDHCIEKCSTGALALYLFLIVVSDGEGVSWWSERSAAARLGMEVDALRQAWAERQAADPVAFEHPVRQVLQLKGGR